MKFFARSAVAALAFCVGCSHAAQQPAADDRSPAVHVVIDASDPIDANDFDGALDAAYDAPITDATIDAEPPDDPMALHHETRAELIALIDVRPLTEPEFRLVRPDIFLALNVGPAVTRMNQGNKAVAHHSRGQRACLAGLEHVTIQTDEQRAQCGAPNMVPVYKHGDATKAAYCIDVFEFPNKPCELPFVWAAPTHAQTMCTIQGKRLCTQEEWSLACRADPAGGPDRTYAYGDDLDLDICNTNKPRGAATATHPKCSAETAEKAWATCGTDTEPSGAFPNCRSRFGVYDMHGNVAEIMTRKDKDGAIVSQLKGSAFFYHEVARKPDDPPAAGGRETYPDQCNYDPRWHIEPIGSAWHVNYHLGFRCCKSLPAR